MDESEPITGGENQPIAAAGPVNNTSSSKKSSKNNNNTKSTSLGETTHGLILTNIEVASLRKMIIFGVICAVVLLVAIIVGGTGPKVYDSTTYNLYQCPNNSHVYTDQCEGQNSLYSYTSPWEQEMPVVSSLSKFWSLQLTPYSYNTTEPTTELVTFSVLIRGIDENGDHVVRNETTSMNVYCGTGFSKCNTFTIIDEEIINYRVYVVNIYISNATSLFIGDCDFTAWKAHESFSSFEIGVHLTLMIISCIGIIAFLVGMRRYSLISWTFEQKFLFALFFSLLLSNNPLFGLQYATQGWFLPFLNAFFTIIFLSTFSIYSLVALDRVRLEQIRTQWDISSICKCIVVGVFTILGIALFSWINIRDRRDPIIGPATSDGGIQILFYLVATIFICILLWILLLVILTVPIAYGKRHLFLKFIFTAVPITVYVISIISGIFAGTFGPLNANALSVTYYNVLNNVFTAAIAYSYWPHINPFQKQQYGSEEERLFTPNEI
ncbi:hypothetical protein CYY_007857 [Polysphondylium violaceum]|uniref:Wntless-like transmembrane domain-containing protein n=1 Tax=Polysphondylium violaceum TaxID=133409 RepID=A0A8J4PNR8_9MYCE|nr:hypothetical protein CYY_007857 [Polysphondylium violaceum]